MSHVSEKCIFAKFNTWHHTNCEQHILLIPKITFNDLYSVCYMIEHIARTIKQRTSIIAKSDTSVVNFQIFDKCLWNNILFHRHVRYWPDIFNLRVFKFHLIYHDLAIDFQCHYAIFKHFVVICTEPQSIICVNRFPAFLLFREFWIVNIGNSMDMRRNNVWFYVTIAQTTFFIAIFLQKIVSEQILMSACRFSSFDTWLLTTI